MTTITVDSILLWFLGCLLVSMVCGVWFWGRNTSTVRSHPMDSVFGSIGIVATLMTIAFAANVFVLGLTMLV
jgi:hypothetical protein